MAMVINGAIFQSQYSEQLPCSLGLVLDAPGNVEPVYHT